MLTEEELKRIKGEPERIINTDEDSICVYRMESLRYTEKEQIGIVERFSNII